MTTPLRPLPSGRPQIRPRGTLSTLQMVLVGVGVLVAVNLIIVAGHVGSRGNEPARLPDGIEAVTPAPNAVIRPQEDIGVDLVDDHTGIVLINDILIPEDQLTIRPALGQVLFRPGEGKEFTRLAPGPHRASVTYWPQEMTQEEAKRLGRLRSYTWQFTAG